MVGDTIKSFKKVASGAIEPVKRIADDTTEQVRRIADGTIEPVRNFVDDNLEPVNRLADGTIMPIRLLTGSKSADDIPDKIDMEYREKIVVRTSLVGIIANILLAAVKALLGLLTNSIAITLDAVNNFTDALSSVVTIIGTKLAGKEPDKNHPFGYGRIEYLTTMIISAIIVYAGITALIDSVEKILEPEEATYSALSLGIMFVAILMKIALGNHFQSVGKKVNSSALVASGKDAYYDSLLSTSVLLSAIIFMAFGISLEAYVGILIAIFIAKAGLELIFEALDDILGRRADNELVEEIKKTICEEENVNGAYDLILHSYGPNRIVGSVHVEVPGYMTAVELDTMQRRIVRRVAEKHKVLIAAVGIYTIDNNPRAKAIRDTVLDIVFSHPEVIQAHGFRLDPVKRVMNLDMIIDYNAKDRDSIFEQIKAEVQEKYPNYTLEFVLDIDI